MKPRIAPQPQPADRLLIEARALLAADPAYAAWSDVRQADDQRAFNHWLDSSEGRAWLATEERAEEARRYPYGRPEQDTGWSWEKPTWGNA